MFDPPFDAPYLWLGLVTVSLTTVGIAVGLTSVPPAGADRLAGVVDEVAASPHLAVEHVRVTATEIRIGPSRLSVRSRGGVSHATLTAGPVTPVIDGPLAAVLRGRRVVRVFEAKANFAAALQDARSRAAVWRPAPETLTARRVSWGSIDVTLVG